MKLSILIPVYNKRYYITEIIKRVSEASIPINAYIFHKYITFKLSVKGKGIILEFTRFFSTYLFSIILGLILLSFFVEMIGIEPKISGAMLMPITVIISYFGHARYSFRQTESGGKTFSNEDTN
jgi:GtrA-like protein.